MRGQIEFGEGSANLGNFYWLSSCSEFKASEIRTFLWQSKCIHKNETVLQIEKRLFSCFSELHWIKRWHFLKLEIVCRTFESLDTILLSI